jgi:hypothetical protein
MQKMVRAVRLSRLRRTTRTSCRTYTLLPPDDGLLGKPETCRGIVTQ